MGLAPALWATLGNMCVCICPTGERPPGLARLIHYVCQPSIVVFKDTGLGAMDARCGPCPSSLGHAGPRCAFAYVPVVSGLACQGWFTTFVRI